MKRHEELLLAALEAQIADHEVHAAAAAFVHSGSLPEPGSPVFAGRVANAAERLVVTPFVWHLLDERIPPSECTAALVAQAELAHLRALEAAPGSEEILFLGIVDEDLLLAREKALPTVPDLIVRGPAPEAEDAALVECWREVYLSVARLRQRSARARAALEQAHPELERQPPPELL